jgi:hypothetical protein
MSNRRSVVPQAGKALDQLKAEVSSELGVTVGADQTARQNGAVGGAMVKRLIQIAEAQIAGK